jgi:hypothetical protein
VGEPASKENEVRKKELSAVLMLLLLAVSE